MRFISFMTLFVGLGFGNAFAQDPFAVENLIEESSITEWKPVMGAFA